jgi:NADH dehydrogenase
MSNGLHTASAHRVVVIGSGFGGLFGTRALRRAPVEVTVIDRTSHHLFQPLLYQVATGILSEGEIAPATREVLRRQRNARVILGEVTGIDLDRREVSSEVLDVKTVTPYDSLIVAAGSSHSYFGHDEFEEFAPGMKSIVDAMELRGRIFGAYEIAEVESDAAAKDAWLTFVVIGGGATGVEMAGQLEELSRRSLRHNFATFDPANTKVILIEAAGGLLTSYGEKLSLRVKRDLERLGVDVRLDTKVVGVDGDGVEVQTADGKTSRIHAKTKIWAAGVAASPLGGLLATASGAQTNRSGQLALAKDLSLPGHPEVFVVGDMMQLPGVPGVAQVAIQGGQFAAGQIKARLAGRPVAAEFRYHDKGQLATIARFKAIAAVGPLRVGGFPAWMLWLVVHLLYLVGFKNRVSVVMHWAVTFLGNGRSERTSTLREAGQDISV